MRTASFPIRRLTKGLFTGLVALGLFGLAELGRSRFYDVSFYLGYLLAGIIVVLAAFNLRKKFPTFPFGTAAGWMQFHLYLGLLTPVVLALHVDWSWPRGLLELTLTSIYGATFLSGVYGLYLTRTLPRMLTRLPVELLYEEYERHVHTIQMEAEQEIDASLEGDSSLAEMDVKRLAQYFARQRSLVYRLRPTISKRRRLIRHLQGYQRYASTGENARLNRLTQLIARRDDFDFHHALQWKLRGWIFGHMSLTWSLLTLIVVHLVLVHLYRGSY